MANPAGSASGPVRDDPYVDIAAGGMAVGADLLVRLVRERLKLGLRQGVVGHVERDCQAEAARVARADRSR